MSTTYTSNDNGNKGLVITENRNEYEFSDARRANSAARIQAFVGLLIVVAVIVFLVVKF